MTKDELKIGLEELADRFSEGWHEGIKIDASDVMLLSKVAEALANVATEDTSQERVGEIQKQRHEANVQKFLGAPQLEQEPVGEVVNATDKAFECKFVKILPIGTKFYTAPPQRTWVGLFDEEIEMLFQTAAGADEEVHIRFARAIESKIKELNT